ncbi:major_cap_HK97, phage major capsid protein, HK97 family [uncultured Caudovirales phage]|uniref:Major_cap_HK97, phage major capsid protein, HK97 family n=1 Tax=uncultured Caudovirales phage TaxID=2100421 RepID=A0A6J7X9B8_9CAUD|nr:major_cap_HK97, phage major capsid protein, HK97 family [uncultured Caudovirales phage]
MAYDNLADKRANLLTQAQAIVTDLAEKGGVLEGDAKQQFDGLVAEAGTIAEAIRSEKAATEARSQADAARAEFAAVIAPKADRDDNAELRELARNGGSKTFEKRDVTRGTGLGNPVDIFSRVSVVAGQVNPYLNPEVVSVYNVSTGNNLQFPRVTALGTAGSFAEAAQITESDGTLSALSLTPVKYGIILQVTNELVNDAAFDLSAMIADKMGAEVAVKHGAVAGTAVCAAAGTAGTAGTFIPTYAELVSLQYSVKQQYRNAPKAGFLTSDANLGTILGITSSSLPIFQPGGQGGVDRLLGKPVYTSGGIADFATGVKGILFGDLSSIATVIVGGIQIESSREFAWDTDLISYKCTVRGATDLVQAQAVKFLKSV